MFTNLELQLIAKTLLTRRDWLNKNLNNPELAAAKNQNQDTLTLIDSILSKVGVKPKAVQAPIDIISAPTAKANKQSPVQKRSQMLVEQIKVLVVDDESLISSLVQSILESAGFKHVHIAEDGLKAISMLYEANPVYDLVLCDWNMPIKNGLDVHNAMRAAERYIDTCFMLVTAVTEAKQIREAIDEGVDDYVVKPIEPQKILKKIARHFPKVSVPE